MNSPKLLIKERQNESLQQPNIRCLTYNNKRNEENCFVLNAVFALYVC